MSESKTFRNWRQGRDPTFSNSSSKHSCMGGKNDQELIMNLGLPQFWWRICNVSSLQSDFGSGLLQKAFILWAKICYHCQVIAFHIARCISDNPNLKAVCSFCVFGFVSATVIIVKSDLSASTSSARQCLLQGNIPNSESMIILSTSCKMSKVSEISLWMAKNFSLLPRLQSLDRT